MSNRASSASGGLGLCSTLVVIFVVLKLTDNITWSWTWVFSPWWIPLSLFAAIVLLYLLFKLCALPFELRARRRKFARDVDRMIR